MTKYLKEILIGLLVIWLAGTYVFRPVKTITKTETEIKWDTLKVQAEVTPKIEWKEKPVKDTTGLAELNATIDSLKEEMNRRVDSTGTLGTYVAEMDTTLQDSTGTDVAKVRLQVESRIPLDPLLKLRSELSIFNKTVTNTVTIEKEGISFWQRFGISAQVGIGRGLITKEWDVYTGIGFHFQIN